MKSSESMFFQFFASIDDFFALIDSFGRSEAFFINFLIKVDDFIKKSMKFYQFSLQIIDF